MKKMMMILALLFAMVGSSFGAEKSGYITFIYSDHNGHILLEIDTEPSKILAIPSPSTYVGKNMLAVALSAKNSKSLVTISYFEPIGTHPTHSGNFHPTAYYLSTIFLDPTNEYKR